MYLLLLALASFVQIQTLAFKLCFLYFNWTGSIKVPGPVRYAHTFSNFIGDRYSVHDAKQFLPHDDMLNRNTLFYI
jgi:aubergine